MGRGVVYLVGTHPPCLSPRSVGSLAGWMWHLYFLTSRAKVEGNHSGFPGGASGKERLQRRRHKRCRFGPWLGKIPWRRARQSSPVFLSGESQGQRSLVGSGTTEEVGTHRGTLVAVLQPTTRRC